MMTECYALHCPPLLGEDRFSRLLSVCDVSKTRRILRFRNAWDAHRSLLGDLMARVFLGRYLNRRPRDLRFILTREGKPVLDGAPDVHFNIAHSGQWVIGAVGQTPVGVDIERMDPVNLDVARRFFSTDEIAWLLESPEEEQTSRFYSLWTLKESWLKMTGRGLGFPLKAFTLVFQGGKVEARVKGRVDTGVRFKEYNLDPGYKTALCLRHGEAPAAFHRMDAETLISQFL